MGDKIMRALTVSTIRHLSQPALLRLTGNPEEF